MSDLSLIRLFSEEGGGGEMGSASQQYCLRWNNHRTNLLTVFDQLLQSEAFTDCTLACEGATIKCHKMVLAACSTYFQTLFLEVACSHPVVVLKDIRYSDMKAILEYMYRGEVNVAQDQLASLLKVAEALKVKGLVEDNGQSAASNGEPASAAPPSPPTISTSANISSLPLNMSPPHSAGLLNQFSKNYMYNKSMLGGAAAAAAAAAAERARLSSMPMWPMPGLPQLASHSLSSNYDSPLKRKKLQSLLNNRDTPILRTVLGQSLAQPTGGGASSASPPGSSQSPAADSSQQPMSLVCHPERAQSNGSAHSRSFKGEPSGDDDQHSYSDLNVDDDMNEPIGKMMLPGSTHPTYSGDLKGIAPYVPTQKPEWKRYKQYTRNDIMSAIDAVRNGMSALQAARKFGVPSRTLYDKVKKLGITTSRPFKRGSFPFGLNASNENISLNHSGSFCSQSEGEEQASSDNLISKSDDGHGEEATTPSVLMRASPSRTPPSPPALLAAQGHFMSSERHFQQRGSSSPSPTASSSHSHDEVEDLSVSAPRKPLMQPSSPPLTQVAVPITPLHPHIVSLKEEHRSTIEDTAVRTAAVGGGGDPEHD